MRPRRTSVGRVVAVALCAACGSRTGLIDPGAGVDSGGAGTGAVGSTGGAGATGGTGAIGGIGAVGGSGAIGGTSGVAGCVALLQVDPVVEIQPGSASADMGPQTVSSSDDGQQVSVAFIRSAALGPASKSDVDAATFSPWLAWPLAGKLAPAVSLLPAVDFASDLRAGSSFGGRFALLLGQGPMLGFTPSIDPAMGPVAPGLPLFPLGAPLFVARGAQPGVHLLGTASQDGRLVVHIVESSGPTPEVSTQTLGCASGGVTADAIGFQDGWLLALSNGALAPPGGCGSSNAGGPPLRIDVLHLLPSGSVSVLHSFKVDAPPNAISVASHPTGAFVAWTHASGGAAPVLNAARVDAVAGAFFGPFVLSGAKAFPAYVDAASTENGTLALAWVDHPPDTKANLVLTMVDAHGDLLQSLPFASSFQGHPNIIGSPSGHSVVISWATTDLASTIQLARFDCLGPG
ncbi:MAG: hypothetical protein IPI67_24435 [Myxococcales bacterium]|nr:hypothetical protein [Myxococcales bacterium]